MSWLTSLFTGKAAENVLDKNDGLLAKAGGFIDRLSYTDEERAENNAKLAGIVLEHVKATAGENTARSLTRRSIAVLWIKCELALLLMCAIAAPWNMDLAQFYYELAGSYVMLFGTLTIITFFFGAHMLSSHLGMGKEVKQ